MAWAPYSPKVRQRAEVSAQEEKPTPRRRLRPRSFTKIIAEHAHPEPQERERTNYDDTEDGCGQLGKPMRCGVVDLNRHKEHNHQKR